MQINTKDNGRNHFRELIVDGKSVSWLTLIDYTVRIGSARLRMGGIAGVGTAEDCRMKGYSRAVLEDTTSYMVREGYDVALLFGIPDYYDKFGYAVCISEPAFSVDAAEIERLPDTPAGFHIAQSDESYISRILQLHNAANDRRPLSIMRDPEFFTEFRKGSQHGFPAETSVIEDADGEFIGYLVCDAVEDRMNVVEIECHDPTAFRLVLTHLAGRSASKGLPSIRFHMPQSHPFAIYCRRMNCTASVIYNRCQGGMGRIINQNTMFVKLRDELGRRIMRSEYCGYVGTILVSTDMGETILSFMRGEVRVACAADSENMIEIPQSKLMQLVTGYRPIRDLMLDDDVTLTGDVVGLLDALFPIDEPYVWLADHF